MPRFKSDPRLPVLAFLAALALAPGAPAVEIPWDNDWRFHPGDSPGAEAPAFPDQDWRRLDLPHDWSIEGAIDPAEPAAGGGGFFPTGIGWYRKKFMAADEWRGGLVWLEFDGISRDSEVWINGHSLGRRPSGYVNFRHAVGPYLKSGGENVVAVRVDNSAQPNSRYYTGSGINRPVRLRLTDPVYVEPDSLTIVTTRLDAKSAALKIRALVHNSSAAARKLSVEIQLIDLHDGPVAVLSAAQRVEAGASWPIELEATIKHPRPWTPDSPVLYAAVCRLADGKRALVGANTTFGLRTVRVSAERGFELNGVPLKLLGGNVHSDNGPLGTAAFDRAERRRAELLKAAGFNAVRTAHNPPPAAFLDACDELGLMVIE